MKIVKYKKINNSKYKILLDNDLEIVLYEDAILKFNLLLTKELDEDILIEADKYNQECDVYFVALKCLKNRMKSINDLRLYLINREYPSDLIDKAIDKLINQGYLNDRNYVKSYINYYVVNSNKGPLKIKKELLEKKIDIKIIDEELEYFTLEEQKDKVSKMIAKGIKTNHTKGGIVLKQKIYNDLKLLGYDISLINSVISNYSFNADKDIVKKEYDKLYRKYSRKYSGNDLERKINEKMYQKGFSYVEEILE